MWQRRDAFIQFNFYRVRGIGNEGLGRGMRPSLKLLNSYFSAVAGTKRIYFIKSAW